MKIKKLRIKNYVGIDEFELDPSLGFNEFSGPKRAGKTSIIDAIGTGFTNGKRRTEVIRHGNDEATIFIETDTGIAIDRRLRKSKTDYMKLRNKGEGIRSTESEIRKLISGDIFRPLDFINRSTKEQTDIILSLVEMNYTKEDFEKWFSKGILNDVEVADHVLKTLKNIEKHYYTEREEIGRKIKVLKARMEGIEEKLPKNYDGNEWKNRDIGDLYAELEKINSNNRLVEKYKQIVESKDILIENENMKLSENIQKAREKSNKEKQSKLDYIEYIQNSMKEIKSTIENSDKEKEDISKQFDEALQRKIEKLKKDYEEAKAEKIREIDDRNAELKDDIANKKQEIAIQENDLKAIDEKLDLKIASINQESKTSIAKQNAKFIEAEEFLAEHSILDDFEIKENIEHTKDMQSYLREWNEFQEIKNKDYKMAQKEYDELTEIIGKARKMPTVLLKKHKCPIDGIEIDDSGKLRINKTLIDGLSDGEKLELAFKVAMFMIGDLKLICLDRFETLNRKEQEYVIKICLENDLQAFATVVADQEDDELIKYNAYEKVDDKYVNVEDGSILGEVK